MSPNRFRKAAKIFRERGVRALLHATWSHVGHRISQPLLRVPLLNYVVGNFVPLYPGKSIWSILGGELAYRLTGEPKDISRTKLSDRSLWHDRLVETARCLEYSLGSLVRFYLRNGPPNTLYFEHRSEKIVEEEFGDEEYTPEPGELLDAYKNIEFWNVNRLMLGYDRYDIARTFASLSSEPLTSLSVLDYGCGVADPAIYLGANGSDVTIVDLDTITLDVAECRLERRGIDYTSHRAEQTETPVDVGEQSFDLIVMSEFLEHVRNPLDFLEYAIEHLEAGGFLYDPVGREFEHEIKGQHLKQAKQTVESNEYQRLHRANLEPVTGNFFLKRE